LVDLASEITTLPVFAAAELTTVCVGVDEALFSVGFAGFSFSFSLFLVSSALRSTGGAVEKSKGTKSNAGASASADLRTDGRDWMWSK